MNRPVALLLSLAMLLAVGGCAAMNTSAQATPTEPADLDVQVSAYVGVQEALAADNFDDARIQLEAFARVAAGPTQGLAEAALEADDIEALRARFKPLSESLALVCAN